MTGCSYPENPKAKQCTLQILLDYYDKHPHLQGTWQLLSLWMWLEPCLSWNLLYIATVIFLNSAWLFPKLALNECPAVVVSLHLADSLFKRSTSVSLVRYLFPSSWCSAPCMNWEYSQRSQCWSEIPTGYHQPLHYVEMRNMWNRMYLHFSLWRNESKLWREWSIHRGNLRLEDLDNLPECRIHASLRPVHPNSSSCNNNHFDPSRMVWKRGRLLAIKPWLATTFPFTASIVGASLLTGPFLGPVTIWVAVGPFDGVCEFDASSSLIPSRDVAGNNCLGKIKIVVYCRLKQSIGCNDNWDC